MMLYLRRTAGSVIAGNGPGDLLATITPITVSNAPSPVPTAQRRRCSQRLLRDRRIGFGLTGAMQISSL